MERSKVSHLARSQGKTTKQLLTELFDKHGSMTAVAREIGVNKSSVSISVARAGLKVKVIVVPQSGNEL